MRSVIQTNKNQCYWCRKEMAHLDNHHIFNGAYKKKSEEDGMIVYLCRNCHRELHDNYVPKRNYKKEIIYRPDGLEYCNELEVKQNAQTIWMSMYGNEEDFIKRYGKSYLWRKK